VKYDMRRESAETMKTCEIANCRNLWKVKKIVNNPLLSMLVCPKHRNKTKFTFFWGGGVIEKGSL
jgi:hypothetical protein